MTKKLQRPTSIPTTTPTTTPTTNNPPSVSEPYLPLSDPTSIPTNASKSALLEKTSTLCFLCGFAVPMVEELISKSLLFGICNGTTTLASD